MQQAESCVMKKIKKKSTHADVLNVGIGKKYAFFNWLIYLGVVCFVAAINLPFLLASVNIQSQSPETSFLVIATQGETFANKIDAFASLLQGQGLSPAQVSVLGTENLKRIMEEITLDPLFSTKVGIFFNSINDTMKSSVSQDQMNLLNGSVFQTIFMADLLNMQSSLRNLQHDMDKISDLCLASDNGYIFGDDTWTDILYVILSVVSE
eukprot:Awhi_evm2s15831